MFWLWCFGAFAFGGVVLVYSWFVCSVCWFCLLFCVCGLFSVDLDCLCGYCWLFELVVMRFWFVFGIVCVLFTFCASMVGLVDLVLRWWFCIVVLVLGCYWVWC